MVISYFCWFSLFERYFEKIFRIVVVEFVIFLIRFIIEVFVFKMFFKKRGRVFIVSLFEKLLRKFIKLNIKVF